MKEIYKNKFNMGFTLIELLAVIVILAIIALIATPIVLNIIGDSKTSGVLRSAEMYENAVEYTIANESLENNPVRNGVFPITRDGNMCLSELVGGVCPSENVARTEVDGEKPTGGYVEVLNGKIVEMFLILNSQYIVRENKDVFSYKEPICTLSDKDSNGLVSVSDEVTCEGESFYVMNSTAGKVTLLSKYNLNLTTNIQSEASGTIAFSTLNYWWDSASGTPLVDANYLEEGRSFPYIYKSNISDDFEQNLVYSHVKEYENYLKRNMVLSADARLVDFEELKPLGCDAATFRCTGPTWVYSTGYWTGNAKGSNYVIRTDGMLSLNSFNAAYGVRPVVEVKSHEIKK